MRGVLLSIACLGFQKSRLNEGDLLSIACLGSQKGHLIEGGGFF